jgi:hypothetical protein
MQLVPRFTSRRSKTSRRQLPVPHRLDLLDAAARSVRSERDQPTRHGSTRGSHEDRDQQRDGRRVLSPPEEVKVPLLGALEAPAEPTTEDADGGTGRVGEHPDPDQPGRVGAVCCVRHWLCAGSRSSGSVEHRLFTMARAVGSRSSALPGMNSPFTMKVIKPGARPAQLVVRASEP